MICGLSMVLTVEVCKINCAEDFGSSTAWHDKQEQISLSFALLYTLTSMKRGHEEISAETSGPNGEQWTRVEKKKKKKKILKAENTHPRFMYSNVEIVKRHHAIAIDVSFFGKVLLVRNADVLVRT